MTIATATAPAISSATTAAGLSFSIDQATLAQHIGIVANAVPSRPNQPILANLLFTATEGRVEITAYDLTIGIRSGFAAKVDCFGSTTIPAKLLTDIVTKLSGELHITERDEKIEIKSSSGKYDIRCLDADEFPALASIKTEESGSISLKTASFLAGLRSTMFCVSSDETKQVLTGVRVEIGDGKSTMASTDGHRLAVIEESEISGELQATIPLKALRDLQRMLGAFPSDEIEFTYDSWGATFRWGNQTLVSRILAGQYPNYRQLLPNSFDSEAYCDRKGLLNAVERIRIIAEQKNNVIKLEFDDNDQSLVVSAEAQDVGSGSEKTACSVKGPGQVIAFNASYLEAGLRQISTEEVVIRFNKPTSPVVVEPVNGDDSTYLVMPVQVRE